MGPEKNFPYRRNSLPAGSLGAKFHCISIHSLDFRSLTHLIINIHTILLRSKPIRHGYGRRKRPAAQDRTTTTGPKRHQLNTI